MADALFSLRGKKIWVAGETGLVGRALVRALSSYDSELLSAPHLMLDLTDQKATFDWLERNRPDAIFMAAAKVGGIGANNIYPADFIRENLSIAQNVIEGAHRADVPRLLFLGSSCIYPRQAAQPMAESSLLTGALEPTNEWYAIAKIAGLKLCQAYRRQYGRGYIAAMPTNLYGPHDHYDAETSHVIPAMMLKFHQAKMQGAKSVTLWGTGTPLREFLHVDDLAQALLVMMERYDGETALNIGSGSEITIRELATLMKSVTGFKGDVLFDAQRPDGAPRKFLDSSIIQGLGWQPSITLEDGLQKTYGCFLGQISLPEKTAA